MKRGGEVKQFFITPKTPAYHKVGGRVRNPLSQARSMKIMERGGYPGNSKEKDEGAG